jgi:hypothetical protein
MKQYLLAVYHPEAGPSLSPEEMEQSFKDTGAVNDEMQAAGAWVFAGGLHPPSTATTVSVRGDEVITTGGPGCGAGLGGQGDRGLPRPGRGAAVPRRAGRVGQAAARP